ncbi:MAG: hypothetical protein ABI588_03505 [Arenimonas sp.]
MDGSIKAWRTHRALSWLYGFVLLAIVGFVVSRPVTPPMGVLFAPMAIVLLMFAFHLVATRGARLRRPWARLASLVIGFILLIGFPVGTIIGLYLISASWSPWPEPYTNAGSPSGAWPSNAVRDRPGTTDRH